MPRLNMPPEKLAEIIAAREALKADRDIEFSKLFAKAYGAGIDAGMKVRPVPIVVGSPVSMFGEGSDKIDRSQPHWVIDDGACGFAWVNVRPGNSPFANWLKRKGIASPRYGGGVEIWISEFNQSVDRKYAMARAMADVLKEAGIVAFAGSRLD